MLCHLLLELMLLQEKVFSPQQMSGLESLMVPPVAALSDWVRGHSCGITFGAHLSHCLAACSSASTGGGASKQGLSKGQALQQLLVQQADATRHLYLLCVVGSRPVSKGWWLIVHVDALVLGDTVS